MYGGPFAPGEWALGYVFTDTKLNRNTEHNFTATGSTPDEFSSIEVEFVEVTKTKAAT